MRRANALLGETTIELAVVVGVEVACGIGIAFEVGIVFGVEVEVAAAPPFFAGVHAPKTEHASSETASETVTSEPLILSTLDERRMCVHQERDKCLKMLDISIAR